MRNGSDPIRARHLLPALVLGLAAGWPEAGSARGAGGAPHGGGSFRGGVVAVPRGGAAGPVRPGIAAFPSHGFQGGRFGQPGAIVVLPRGTGFPFGAIGIPPLAGTAVPPLASTAVPPFGNTAVRPFLGLAPAPPVRPSVGAVEVWRLAGGAWRLDPTVPAIGTWRRGQDGRWFADTAGVAVD